MGIMDYTTLHHGHVLYDSCLSSSEQDSDNYYRPPIVQSSYRYYLLVKLGIGIHKSLSDTSQQ